MATYFRKDGWVKSAVGPAVPGAQVFVCTPQPANVPSSLSAATPTPTPLADVFSDSNGLVPIDQPIITDGFGHYVYYAEPDLYTEAIYLSGILQEELPDQSVGGFGNANPPGNNTGLIAGTGIQIVGSTISATTLPVGIQVNGVDTDDQGLIDFEDTSSVVWANPSGGIIKATVTAAAVDALVNARIWKAVPNSGTLGDNVGFAPNIISSGNSLISATATQTNYNTYTTSASPGNISTVCFSGMTGSGLNPNVLQIWSTQTLKACKWQAALVDVADVRVWMALCDLYSGNTANLVADTPNLNLIGFRYSTAAGDTTWQAVCVDNGGGSTVVDTGVAVDTLGHSFGILVSPSSISFKIDSLVVATIDTNLPVDTVLFGDVISVDNIGLGNTKTVALAAFSTAE